VDAIQTELDNRLSYVVCIVENVTPQWIAALGTRLHLEAEFFANHADNPTPWRMHKWSADSALDARAYRHVDGTYWYFRGLGNDVGKLQTGANHFERPTFPGDEKKHEKKPMRSHTRMSYYRVSERLCKSDVDCDADPAHLPCQACFLSTPLWSHAG